MPPSRPEDSVPLAAFAWGFAEATLFFIVPDVLLSWVALCRPRRAWLACLWALAGALVGGSVMYWWGSRDAQSALAVVAHVPAVGAATCDAVAAQLQEQGILALFIGPFTGVPYKVYAVQAGAGGVHPALFLAVSVPARLLRFALVVALTTLICRLFPNTTLPLRRALHVVAWTAFYAWFFWKHAAG